MSWQIEMVTLLRVMINDLGGTQTYDDSRLQQAIAVGAQLIQVEMNFSQLFVPDITVPSITPDPTDRAGNTRDDSFINLCCLKTACIIERGETRKAAGQGIYIKDAGSAIDTRSQVLARLKMLDKNWCAVFDDAKLEYMAGQVRVAGAAIMSPFRLYAYDMGYAIPTFGYEERR